MIKAGKVPLCEEEAPDRSIILESIIQPLLASQE